MPRKPARDPQDILLGTLRDAIKKGVLKEQLLEVAAPCKMQGKRSNGEYRTAAVNGGTEFLFDDVYVGKRADTLIFVFKPVDPSGDFEQYELNDTKVFIAFPEVESLVVRSLGFDDVDTDDNKITFAMVKGQFLKKIEAEEAARADAEEKAEATESATHYDDHPLYGVWG
jgi:hypothetical protein